MNALTRVIEEKTVPAKTLQDCENIFFGRD